MFDSIKKLFSKKHPERGVLLKVGHTLGTGKALHKVYYYYNEAGFSHTESVCGLKGLGVGGDYFEGIEKSDKYKDYTFCKKCFN